MQETPPLAGARLWHKNAYMLITAVALAAMGAPTISWAVPLFFGMLGVGFGGYDMLFPATPRLTNRERDYLWLMGPEPPLCSAPLEWCKEVPEVYEQRARFMRSWPDPMEPVDTSEIEAALDAAWLGDGYIEVPMTPEERRAVQAEKENRLLKERIKAYGWGPGHVVDMDY